MMTEHLVKLYQSYKRYFLSVAEKFHGNSVSGPFLSSPENTAYRYQKLKVLIVGREEKKWIPVEEDIQLAMELYEKFHSQNSRPKTAHWKICEEVEKKLKVDLYSSAQTKLNRYTVNNKQPQGIYLKETLIFDELLVGEIIRMKPDVVLFFTGPKNDWRLEKVFDGMLMDAVSGFKEPELAKIRHAFLPHHSYRTYHPEYLVRSKLDKQFLNFLQEAVRFINPNSVY